MPHRIQDIIQDDKRSIRNVPIEHVKEAGSLPSKRMTLTPPAKKHKSKSKNGLRMLVILAIVVVLGGLAWIASAFFSKATFTLTAKVVPIKIENSYFAKNSPADGYLLYQLITLKESASSTAQAVLGPAISTKAQGKITIFNAYGTISQRLVAGTRLANSSGKIYRLAGSIVVPGYATSNGNKLPGSIITTIIADQAGESYNISKADAQSDFKIIGFKGSPKFEGFYGRLASDISGGFVGAKKIVDDKILSSTTASMKSKLTSSLVTQAKNLVKEGYLIYNNAYVISFSVPSLNGGDKNSVNITLEGTINAFVFKRSDLSEKIAGDKAIESFGKNIYKMNGLELLSFSVVNPKDFSPEKKNTLIFKLKGDMKLIGEVPVENLKKRLAGLALSETQAVFAPYSGVIDIAKSEGEVVPPWSKVPADISRISIVVKE